MGKTYRAGGKDRMAGVTLVEFPENVNVSQYKDKIYIRSACCFRTPVKDDSRRTSSGYNCAMCPLCETFVGREYSGMILTDCPIGDPMRDISSWVGHWTESEVFVTIEE